MAFLSVRTQVNQAFRDFPQLSRNIPTLARNAINKTATNAERTAVTTIAKDMKLPARIIRNRLDRNGRVKASRTEIRRASTRNLNTTLLVWPRGIPVYQVSLAYRPRKGGGVKAQGGRFYRGAFKVNKPGKYAGVVFKRMTDARKPLMMPKIGVKQRLVREFTRWTTGRDGAAWFEREFAEQLRRTGAKYGVRV